MGSALVDFLLRPLPLPRVVQAGSALSGLLRRPATLAWVVLSGFAAITGLLAVSMVWGLILSGTSLSFAGRGPAGGRDLVLGLLFALMVGVLVGQAIKELQHCSFAWGLPRLRRRLLVGTLMVAALVAPAREIVFAVASWALVLMGETRRLMYLWDALPAPSLGVFAIMFLAFWIGVRPTWMNTVGVMAPLLILVPVLQGRIVDHPVAVVFLTAPLVAFLIHDTFSVESARRRPFLDTATLTGAGVKRGVRDPAAAAATAANWRLERVGSRLAHWLRAGAHENHGFRPLSVRGGVLLLAGLALSYTGWRILEMLWTVPGSSVWDLFGGGRIVGPRGMKVAGVVSTLSVVLALAVAVQLVLWASISLIRRGPYRLSRRELARLEYWSSAVENLVVCGLTAAVLLGFWFAVLVAEPGWWQPLNGGPHGWVALLLRPLVLVFMLLPVAQLFRLRYLRGPVGWSMVRVRVTVLALTLGLVFLGAWILPLSYWLVPATSLMGDVFLFGLIGLLLQGRYRLRVERHFAAADLA